MSYCFDLHVHTQASDGSWTPAQLVQEAIHKKARLVAVTDHDTMDAVAETVAIAKHAGLAVLPGVELTASFDEEMHILGYGLSSVHEAFRVFAGIQRMWREERNQAMIHMINRQGMPLASEEVYALSGGDVCGRLHIAMAMAAKGYAADVSDAFARWLLKGRPCYVPRQKAPPAACIRVIREAGGCAILAHPGHLEKTGQSVEKACHMLMDLGIQGLEVFYPSHTEDQVQRYTALAERLQLWMTYGSDAHGEHKKDNPLLMDFERFSIPDKTYSMLEQMMSQQKE